MCFISNDEEAGDYTGYTLLSKKKEKKKEKTRRMYIFEYLKV